LVAVRLRQLVFSVRAGLVIHWQSTLGLAALSLRWMGIRAGHWLAVGALGIWWRWPAGKISSGDRNVRALWQHGRYRPESPSRHSWKNSNESHARRDAADFSSGRSAVHSGRRNEMESRERSAARGAGFACQRGNCSRTCDAHGSFQQYRCGERYSRRQFNDCLRRQRTSLREQQCAGQRHCESFSSGVWQDFRGSRGAFYIVGARCVHARQCACGDAIALRICPCRTTSTSTAFHGIHSGRIQRRLQIARSFHANRIGTRSYIARSHARSSCHWPAALNL
jgi:hypothetical protein